MSLEAFWVGNANGHAEREGLAGGTWGHGTSFSCSQEQHRHSKPRCWGEQGQGGHQGQPSQGLWWTWEGTTLPSPPAHRSFHLSSDMKETLLLERHSSFPAPTRIVRSGILEPLRSLKAVLFPCYNTKPSQNRALLFTGLPQPRQEGIAGCDPYFKHAEDALTAPIQLQCMSTVPTCKHLHPPISRVLDTGRQLPARRVTSQDCHTRCSSFSRKPQPSHNQSKGFLQGTRTAVILWAINFCTEANSTGRQLEKIFLVRRNPFNHTKFLEENTPVSAI